MRKLLPIVLLFMLALIIQCRWTPAVSSGPSVGGSSGTTSPSASGSHSPPQVCRARITKASTVRMRARVLMPRIVGGRPSAPGAWPWAAALETSDGFQYCGATLVKPQWVLTAGHCEVRPGELAVINRVDLRTQEGEAISIDEVRTHELFAGAEKGYDVALAHLKTPAKAKPIPMIIPGWFGEVTATAVGYGLTSEGTSATSPVLRETKVPILPMLECEAAYVGLPFTALCAGLPQGGSDTCQGDSGGGLFVPASGPGWVVVGITSFGDGCARPGRPGVYTSVSTVVQWVEDCTQ